MTDIDPQADIELHSADGHVTVGVPLAGAVTDEWLRCYQELALATKVPAQAQARHDQAWIVVSVPGQVQPWPAMGSPGGRGTAAGSPHRH